MGRLSRGWDLTMRSWEVVKADRSLLLFPVVSFVAALLVFIVMIAAGGGVGAAADTPYAAIPFVVVGLYLLIVVQQFSAVAVAACASKALDGQETTFGDGIRAARGRMSVILQWSLVQLVVGGIITAIQSALRQGVGQLIGDLIGGIANASWSVATYFVVPVLALDGVGPREAFRRSTGVIRERWGEGVVGAASIGLPVFLLGFLPGALLIAAGVAVASSAPAATAVFVTAGVIIVAIALVLQATLTTVFRVALYEYATQGRAHAGFSQQQLDGAFKERKRRGLFGR